MEIPSRKDEIRQVTPKDPVQEMEDKSTYHAKIKKSDSGSVLGAIPLNSRSSSNSSVTSTGQSSRRVTKKTTKKKKNACYFDSCSSAASKFIGDCNFCKGHFCSKHRLMENHACDGLTSCKEQLHQRNADKLEAEQTKAPKIQI
ncbi:YOR052C-like protein [Saccharomyces kudriavzevii IFO 1802]|nr:YOR052C-like protein [Saccharomyces cerevisiae x Saccharomyces kudriavzevii VIN7]EJT43632.1 YOR052C-like protein [Saccharomyces kudriavzevii IFO 1802]